MNWETIICVGDSITIGSRSYLGYPEYCGDFLSKHTHKSWNVVNHAVAGFTTIDLARSIDKNFSNLKSIKPDIATVLIGTNDLKSPTSPALFRAAYEQVVTKVQLIIGNTNIILLELPTLMDGVMLPYKTGMNQTIAAYNTIIKDIATKKDLIYAQLEYNETHFYDGVHLNEPGSEHVGKQISDHILTLRKS
jgi:lysophospholipase L1-like esterase